MDERLKEVTAQLHKTEAERDHAQLELCNVEVERDHHSDICVALRQEIEALKVR